MLALGIESRPHATQAKWRTTCIWLFKGRVRVQRKHLLRRAAKTRHSPNGNNNSYGVCALKKVIIIGGGYGGAMLARKLDEDFDVVLVEPRKAFVHNVAAIRAIVDPTLMSKIIMPYGKMLKRGRVVQARVTEILDEGVFLSTGESLEGDYTIVATGSANAKPFKPIGDDIEEFKTSSALTHAALSGARHVAIVGAGAVGTELAGEIATGFPEKSVTLISNVPIFPDYPTSLRKKLRIRFDDVGIRLLEGRKARLDRFDAAFAGPIVLDDGTTIAADLVIPALGSKPVINPLAAIAGARLGKNGRIIVDPWLRPTSRSNLFAFGDMADTGDLMTVAAFVRQIPFLAKALTALDAGIRLETLVAYKPWNISPIVLPVGPKRGASVLPITKRGLVVGDMLTSLAKGKSLLITRYRKDFGLKGQ